MKTVHSAVAISLAFLSGCVTVNPGHLGLVFGPAGMQTTIVQPGIYYLAPGGRYYLGPGKRIDDVDVTYSTKTEDINGASAEGLSLATRISVIYRPVADQLVELSNGIGLTSYFDEVVGPEFRSAARGVFARHSYLELLGHNEEIENEIEADLRRRIIGKHVEISSVTIEAESYAPAIGKAVQDKLVAEQDALRQKTLLENEASRRKLEAQTALQQKQQEMELAKQQVALDKMREESTIALDKLREESAAEKGLIKARAEAEELKLRAAAQATQGKAMAEAHARENQALTPLAVMVHAYDALGSLGRSDAHVYLGDWSHVPGFLLPPSLSLAGLRSDTPRKTE
jgi:regulator of protease activity HflC (stomatin/prohibitin superfamily)